MTISARAMLKGDPCVDFAVGGLVSGHRQRKTASFVAVSPFRRIVRAINQLRRFSVPASLGCDELAADHTPELAFLW
jgi:hypothetical protein